MRMQVVAVAVAESSAAYSPSVVAVAVAIGPPAFLDTAASMPTDADTDAADCHCDIAG